MTSENEPPEMTSSTSSAIAETKAVRDKIFRDFDAAETSEQRSALLGMFKVAMDIAEAFLEKSGDAQRLAEFRERRADDYAQLLVKESSVGPDLSPEMFMAVTNREITAGRMSSDDPIRQVAVRTVAVPHRSHSELLAVAEARTESDMSIQRLINDLRAADSFDIAEVRNRLIEEFDRAVTSDQRGRVLALFNATMDSVERNLAAHSDQGRLLENLRDAREKDYKIFIVKECTVGLDSPEGGDVSVEMLMAVTNREIEAGRMTEDHSLRKIAVEGAAVPHSSHAELVAKHANLKSEAAQVSISRSQATAEKSSGLGALLGRKLKGLLR